MKFKHIVTLITFFLVFSSQVFCKEKKLVNTENFRLFICDYGTRPDTNPLVIRKLVQHFDDGTESYKILGSILVHGPKDFEVGQIPMTVTFDKGFFSCEAKFQQTHPSRNGSLSLGLTIDFSEYLGVGTNFRPIYEANLNYYLPAGKFNEREDIKEKGYCVILGDKILRAFDDCRKKE